MAVPVDPRQLFEEFLPRQVERYAFPLSRVSAALAVRVCDEGDWSISLAGGRLEVRRGVAEETVVQVSVAACDFEALVVHPLEHLATALDSGTGASESSREAGLRALLGRVARWDAETVALLRQQTGSVVVVVEDGERRHRVAVTPGRETPAFDDARCTVTCQRDDLVAVQEGRQNPFDLLYGGRLQIAGDAQIAVALAGLFL